MDLQIIYERCIIKVSNDTFMLCAIIIITPKYSLR